MSRLSIELNIESKQSRVESFKDTGEVEVRGRSANRGRGPQRRLPRNLFLIDHSSSRISIVSKVSKGEYVKWASCVYEKSVKAMIIVQYQVPINTQFILSRNGDFRKFNVGQIHLNHTVPLYSGNSIQQSFVGQSC